MIYETKKVRKYDRTIIYAAYLLLIISCILLFFISYTIQDRIGSMLLKIIAAVFAILPFVVYFGTKHEFKRKIYKLEIEPDKFIIYVGNRFSESGIEQIELVIEQCEIKEKPMYKGEMQIHIKYGKSHYQLSSLNFEDDDYRKIRNTLIANYKDIGSLPEYKQVTSIASLGFLFGMWAIIFPKPLILIYLILIFYPILAMITLKLILNKLKEYEDNRNTASAVITGVLFFPCLSLLLRVISDWNILTMNWPELFIPFFVITAIYLVCLIIFITGTNISDTFVLLSLITCFLYGSQITVVLNCLLDPSLPVISQATVIDKRVHSFKFDTTYYLKISPSDLIEKEREVMVEKAIYLKANPKDEVDVFVRKGLFNMAWYYIRL